jgi:hypothetical protein
MELVEEISESDRLRLRTIVADSWWWLMRIDDN